MSRPLAGSVVSSLRREDSRSLVSRYLLDSWASPVSDGRLADPALLLPSVSPSSILFRFPRPFRPGTLSARSHNRHTESPIPEGAKVLPRYKPDRALRFLSSGFPSTTHRSRCGAL